jgi:hypothetical protein
LLIPNFDFFQLRQYVPDDRVVGHSANIAELDVDSEDEEEEYILVSSFVLKFVPDLINHKIKIYVNELISFGILNIFTF